MDLISGVAKVCSTKAVYQAVDELYVCAKAIPSNVNTGECHFHIST